MIDRKLKQLESKGRYKNKKSKGFSVKPLLSYKFSLPFGNPITRCIRQKLLI